MGTLLLIPLIVVVIAVVVGAFIIQLATRMVAGFTPSFGTCVVTAIVATIAAVILHIILGMVLGAGMGGRGLALIAGFLVNTFVINMMVKNAGAEMGFGKAALVSVMEYVIYIVLAIICAILFGAALIGGVSAMAH
jgi:hypothetical protein